MATTTLSLDNGPIGRQESRDRLMLAALPYIAFDGWVNKAFLAGALNCDMKNTDFRRLFPGGVREAIFYFSNWADRRMVASLSDQAIDTLSIRKQVALAVRLRFEVLAPHREAVRRTLSLLALPSNASLGVRCLYCTVNSVWHAIGDRSVDFNFYTKRALLAAVVSTTTLYWLDDMTDGCEGSWKFLDRRLADVMNIPTFGNQLRSMGVRLPDPLGILRAVRARAR